MKHLINFNTFLLVVVFSFFSCTKEDDLVSAGQEHAISEKTMNFPKVIPLPDGFNPEGIVAGNGNTLYVGSLFDGSIYRIDSRTGDGSILVPAQTNRIAVGLDFDSRTGYIYVAGGTDGYGYVYNADTGTEVAAIQLTPSVFPNAMINDVVVTANAAYFTNSFAAEIYKVPLNGDGTIPNAGVAQTISLTGDFTMIQGFNANGIVANDDGTQLIIVNSALGTLYLTDVNSGMTTEIDLGGSDVINGDGLVLRGNKLYVVQNFNNQVSVVMLSGDWTSGSVIQIITDSGFQIPATATIKGNSLYVVNARFDVAPPPFLGQGYDPNIEFNVVAVNAN